MLPLGVVNYPSISGSQCSNCGREWCVDCDTPKLRRRRTKRPYFVSRDSESLSSITDLSKESPHHVSPDPEFEKAHGNGKETLQILHNSVASNYLAQMSEEIHRELKQYTPSILRSSSHSTLGCTELNTAHGPNFSRLIDYCRDEQFETPKIKIINAQFVTTPTWKATIIVRDAEHSSRSSQGSLTREEAVEDAAFIALKYVGIKEVKSVFGIRDSSQQISKATELWPTFQSQWITDDYDFRNKRDAAPRAKPKITEFIPVHNLPMKRLAQKLVKPGIAFSLTEEHKSTTAEPIESLGRDVKPESCLEWHAPILNLTSVLRHREEIRCPKCFTVLRKEHWSIDPYVISPIRPGTTSYTMSPYFNPRDKRSFDTTNIKHPPHVTIVQARATNSQHPRSVDTSDQHSVTMSNLGMTSVSQTFDRPVVKTQESFRKDKDTDEKIDIGGNALAPRSLHFNDDQKVVTEENWRNLRNQLPENWKWDIEYKANHSIKGTNLGCWTCTPSEPDDPKDFPLKLYGRPIVIPVECKWPPMAGVNPPPDPRPYAPIDSTTELSLDVIRDLFLTFHGSIGFYLLINGLLQIIVQDTFDREWAASHLPHNFGGLRVSYLSQTLEPTANTAASNGMTANTQGSSSTQKSGISSLFRPSRNSAVSSILLPRINDHIEAKPKALHRKDKFVGRIGLKVAQGGEPYLIMSTHVITEAILAKSSMSTLLGRQKRFDKLDDDWNDHVEIWAGNDKVGKVHHTFDSEAEIYPNGFKHDVTLIKPTSLSSIRDIASSIPNIGWLSAETWHTLRQQPSTLGILDSIESDRSVKTLKCFTPSQVLVVGEGIFLNSKAAKPSHEHGISVWKDLISRAVLYRVNPDFDPPTGYSGTALYAEGLREDGTQGPGIVGFQSFVQRSEHVQNYDMEGDALDKRLRSGRVAFYGAFQVPDELRKIYQIV